MSKIYKTKKMKNPKIALIGATGKAGKYILTKLLERNYQVKLLLRNPENFQIQNPLIKIIKGDARDYDSIENLIENCDLVISALGQPKGEKTIFSDATSNIIKAFSSEKGRYILITGLSVNSPFDSKNESVIAATKWMHENYQETTSDKQKEYEILSKSNLDWTVLRLPLIVQTDVISKIGASIEDCKGRSVSASSLAEFISNEIENEEYIKKSPFVFDI